MTKTPLFQTKPVLARVLSRRGKSLIDLQSLPLILTVALLGVFLSRVPLQANPSGGDVAAGQAQIAAQGSTLTITQGSDRAVINWQDFSIGVGETTQFIQPSSTSAMLNRVISGNPSQIYGNLTANGQVYLINPNGILVGAGGVVNTAGFLASTLDVSDESFLRGGDLRFTGTSNASVVNLGSISASEGDVILIARTVENRGEIRAPNGTAALAAGNEVLVKAAGEERVFVQPEGGEGSSVSQAGLIEAATAELKAAGGNEYALAIKHSGVTRATGVVKRGGRIMLSAGGKGGISNSGRLVTRKSSGEGGEVRIKAGGNVANDGIIDAAGTKGGRVEIAAERASHTGLIIADGSVGSGGSVTVTTRDGYHDTRSATISARGALDGGTIRVESTEVGARIYSSSTMDVGSPGGLGGSIVVTADELYLMGSRLIADGASGGGEIFAGGGIQGHNAAVANATTLYVNQTSLFTANATGQGHGGTVVLWAEGTTQFLGQIEARGGVLGGDGGFMEVSGKQSTRFGGFATAEAPMGQAGTLLLDPKNIIVDAVASGGNPILFEFIDPNKAAGNNFGGSTVALSTGNVAITATGDDFGASNAGAAYLFDGSDGTLISTLRGSKANDQVGNGGVTALSNGNYVVGSYYWKNGAAPEAGAATWGDGTLGVSGVVDASNSLVGSKNSDWIGKEGITALSNGNYVVSSSNWDNGVVVDAGAVTWGNGMNGTVGAVTTGNSLVGSKNYDKVGLGGGTALSNGNYVVSSSNWDNGAVVDAGAVTWGNGVGGTVGAVSVSNSLVGSKNIDYVGNAGITALSNGNYVVSSYYWDNGTVVNAGAATWGNGTNGTFGTVSDSNSLVGSKNNDNVGLGGITALSNGNYVVRSTAWGNGTVVGAGAVTWGNGTIGTMGTVSVGNSLVGSNNNDFVGIGGITVLSNGNYVVNSYGWDNGMLVDVGAVTWGNGTSGTFGTVSLSNSLVGSKNFDNVGVGGITALSNGNYVVSSTNLDNGMLVDVGAVTWANGTSGTFGTVSVSNSLVGSNNTDRVGNGGITALSNGNYVVSSTKWDNGMIVDAGAATWGNGMIGIVGTVSASNSLVGSQANDQVGSGGITALSNGNYVVSSDNWANGAIVGAGAVTWANGVSGRVGTVTLSNSLVGSQANDQVGSGGITALSNGNYVVRSQNWANGAIVGAGAATWGKGLSGLVGEISASNSILGGSVSAGLSNIVTDDVNGTFIARFTSDTSGGAGGRVYAGSSSGPGLTSGFLFSNNPADNVTITAATITAITNTGTAVILQANNDITVNAAITSNNASGNGGALTFQAGRSILLNANITTDNGNLTLVANETTANGVINAHRDAGAALITMAAGTSIDAGTGTVSLTLANGAGKTNFDSGVITLRDISAGAVTVTNVGSTTGSNLVLSGAIAATGPVNLTSKHSILGNSGASVITSGDLSLHATGLGTGTFAGINLNGTTLRTTGAGNLSLTATGGDTGTGNHGILLSNTLVESVGTGTISLVGTGRGSSGTTNHGIAMQSVAAIKSLSGNILLNGLGGFGSRGIDMVGASTIDSTGAAEIRLNGVARGDTGATSKHGISLSGANTAIRSSGSGLIHLTGQGGSGAVGNIGGGHYGISVATGTTISSTGTGAIQLYGNGGVSTGAAPGAANFGVAVSGSNALVTSATGNILISGVGGGHKIYDSGSGNWVTNPNLTVGIGNNHDGIRIGAGGKVISTGAASITFDGTAGLGTGTSSGIWVTGAGAEVRSEASGDIHLTGFGGIHSTDNGIYMFDGAKVASLGTGKITLDGTMGSSGTAGIRILGSTTASSVIESVSGTIHIKGQANVGSGSGILMGSQTSAYGSEIISSGGAEIILEGIEGSVGINLTGSSVNRVGTGSGGAPITSGNITLITDTLTVGSLTEIQSSGNLLIQPRTATASIGLGDSAVGTLNLTAAELDSIQDGFASITIGHGSGSGAMDVRGYTYKDDVILRTPIGNGDITLNGALATGSGTAAGTITLQAGRSIVGNSGASVTTQGEEIVINADRDASNGGNIQLTGTTIASNGGKITLGGGANPLTTAAIGMGTGSPLQKSGIYLNLSSLNAGSGAISLRGQGIAGTGNSYGIHALGGSVIGTATTTGNITLHGTGGSVSGTGSTIVQNDGVFLTGSGTAVQAAEGAISIMGFGGGGGGSDHYGVHLLSGARVQSYGTGANAATITLIGQGGNGSAGNSNLVGDRGYGRGVFLNSSAVVSSVDGNITLTGTAGSVGGQNLGVYVGNSVVESTGTGANAATVTLNGTGGNAAGNNYGVYVSGNSGVVRSAVGDVTITGKGGDGGGSNLGIVINSSGRVESTGTGADAAKLILNGTGGNGTSSNRGIYMTTNGQIRSVTGAISLTGVGGDGTSGNHGINLFSDASNNGGKIISTGTGANAATITLHGTSGSGTTNHGVYLTDIGTEVASVNGSLSITGVGLGTASNGVLVGNGAKVATTGSSSITVMATGAGAADFASIGVVSSLGGASATGDVTINADTIDWGASLLTLQSSGNLLIQPRTAGTTIGLGNGASGILNLDVAELNGIQNGFASITIGHAAGTGAVDVRSYAFKDDVTIRTPGSDGTITLNGNLSTGSGTLAGDVTLLAGRNIVGNSSASVITSIGDITLHAAGLGTGNFSGITLDGTILRTTGSGNLSLTGTGGGVGSNLYGIHAYGGATVEAQDSGTVDMTGVGSAVGTGTNIGVRVESVGTLVGVKDGNLTISGTGGSSTGTFNFGIYLNNEAVMESTGIGTVGLTGLGGSNGTNSNYGVSLAAAAELRSAMGNIAINGTGGGTGTDNVGIYLNTGAAVESNGTGANAATVTLTGTGSSVGSGTGFGVRMDGASTVVSSVDGNIAIIGQGGGSGTGTQNSGIYLSNGAAVESTGAGANAATVTLTGSGGTGSTGGQNYGTHLTGTDTAVRSVDGNIAINGTGGGSGGSAGNSGIYITTGAAVESTGMGASAATVTLTGIGGTSGTGGSNYGTYLTGVNAAVRSVDGNITINGTGGNSGTSNFGIVMTSGGTVESTGTGASAATITMNGTGGNGTSSNYGFYLRDTTSRIKSVDGAVALTGIGQGGSGNGIHFAGGFKVETSDSAPITLTATGANTSTDLIATVGSTSISDTANGLGGSTATGDITINADTIDWGASRMTLQSSGNLLIQPRTATASIGLGNSAVGTLNLTAAELDGIQDGFTTITIGHGSGSGSMDVRGYTYKDDVILRTPIGNGDITLNGALATGSGSEAGTITLQAGRSVIGNSGASVTTQGVEIVINADRDASNGGNIQLTGTTIASNGGNVTLGGGADPLTTAAIGMGTGSAQQKSGIYLNLSSLNAGSGILSLRGQGIAGTTDAYGIYALGGSVIGAATATGDIALHGTGGDGTTGNHGIYLTGANTAVRALEGAISLTGIGYGSGTGNHGINVTGGSRVESVGTAAGAATLTLHGTGGKSINSHGVNIDGSTTVIRSGYGDIGITGLGGGAGGTSGIARRGVYLSGGTRIISDGTGPAAATITITGTGGAGTGQDQGVYLNNGKVRSVDGDISIAGTAFTSSHGLFFYNGSEIQATGGADIHLIGQGPAGDLTLYRTTNLTAVSKLISHTGDIIIEANTWNSDLLNTDGLNANFIESTGGATAGRLIIRPRTVGTTIGIGGAGVGTLSLNDTRLGFIKDGFSEIIIGSATAGNISTNAATFTDSLRLLTGGNLAVNGALNTGANRLALIVGGDTTQAAALTAGSLRLGGNGNFTLLNASNNIATLAKDGTGSVSLRHSAGLNVGTVDGVNGVSGSTIDLRTDAGNLTLSQAVTGSASGNAVVLSTPAALINNVGASGVSTPNGRWLIYTNAPAGNTYGGLLSGNQALYNRTYTGNPPTGITENGSRYLFANQPTLTFTSTSDSKTYGDDFTVAIADNFTASGFVNAATYGNVFTQDTLANIASGTAVASSTGAVTTASVGSSPYSVLLDITGVSATTGYALSKAETGQLTVGQKALTVTANNQSKTYGDIFTFAGTEFSTTGLINGDTVTAATFASGGSVGTATVTGSTYGIIISGATGTGVGNYSISYVSGSLTVNKRDITVTAIGGTSTYGASPSNPGLSAANLASFDTVSALTGLSNSFGIDNTTNVGNHVLSVDGALTNGNYNVTSRIDGNWTVGQKALTVTANNQSKTYGDTFTFAGTEFSTNGLINGDAVTSTTIGSTGAINTATVVGSTYSVAISGASGSGLGNYNISYIAGSLTVNKRDITVTAIGGTSTYGDSPSNPGLSATNLASFDTVSALTGLSNSFGIDSTTNVGNYVLSVDGTLTNGNYNVTSRIDGNWTVGQKALTVTANNQSKTYGDTFTFAGTEFSTIGLINGDAVTSATIGSTGAVNTATVVGSTYSVAISAASGSGLGNYSISYVDGSLTVNKRDITVTALGGTSTYGDSPSNPGLSAANLASFDIVSALTGLSNSFGIDSTTNVGNHVLSVDGTLTNGNYNITSRIDGNWTVGQKALTVTANNQSKTYGDTFTFAGTEFTVIGLTNGDSVNRANLASAGALNTASVAGSPYTITINNALGSGLSNYAIQYVNGQLTFSRKIITVTADNVARLSRQPNPTFTATFDGFSSTDGVGNLNGFLHFATEADFASAPGTYSLRPSGLSSPDYAFNYVEGQVYVIQDLLRQTESADPFHFLFSDDPDDLNHWNDDDDDLKDKVKYEIRVYPGTISTLSSGEVP